MTGMGFYSKFDGETRQVIPVEKSLSFECIDLKLAEHDHGNCSSESYGKHGRSHGHVFHGVT
jgi:hypothetical protein